uniref:ATP synthase F0 subunit 6 n=1 Tax=Gammarus nipponensis TaxID=353628 RepID=UPI00286C179F|nr:ATP synthase F0 subunit 6 [Gammarus nipponensis]WLS55460.1 ATP synthase F0 subunit 6 [Gammarus nipponensis]
MMTNIFSIFDPSSPTIMSSNWLSLFIIVLICPPMYWVANSRLTCAVLAVNFFSFKEFSPLLKKAPYILIFPVTLLIFIMSNNLMGLPSYIFTASSQLIFTATLALPAWLALMLYGWMNNLSNLLTHLIPQNTPLLLMPFMVLIETISNLIRPITLAIRLTANMVAGHLLIVLLNSADTVTPLMLYPILFSTKQLLLLLELAVAFIQAYVFSVLVTLYMAEFTN